jgi:hypothetical protein
MQWSNCEQRTAGHTTSWFPAITGNGAAERTNHACRDCGYAIREKVLEDALQFIVPLDIGRKIMAAGSLTLDFDAIAAAFA